MTTIELLRLCAAIVALVAVIALWRAIRHSQRSRTAAYYTTRREAGQTASQHFTTFFILTVASIVLFVISTIWPAEPSPAELAESRQLVAQPTIYILPTSTAPATGNPANQPTEQPSPESTSTGIPTAVLVTLPTKTPVGTDIRLPAYAKRMILSAISHDVDANGRPISPTTEFTKGIATVYIFYDYHDIPQGSQVRQNWLCDGRSVHTDSATWTLTGTGNTSISWSPTLGYSACLYEVRILLNDVKQFTANFVVR